MVEQSRPKDAEEPNETPRLKNELLTTNPALEELVLQVGRTVPNLGEIRPYLPLAHALQAKVGIYAEAYLAHVLTGIAQTAAWQDKIKVNFADKKRVTKNFRFVNNGLCGYKALKKETNNSFVEYDLLTEVDGIPVVWEVKTLQPTMDQRNQKSLTRAFAPSRINMLSIPLKEHSSDRTPFQMGYVVVVNPEQVRPDDPRQSDFTQRKGIILSLPVAYAQLVEGVRRIEGN